MAGVAGLEPAKMLESKSSALPAWLHPNIMVHLGGFEPPAHGLEVRCSILLSYRCTLLIFYGAGEGNRTLATSLEGWGSTTELHPHIINLLLLVEETGFEPVKAELTDLQSVPFGQLGNSS